MNNLFPQMYDSPENSQAVGGLSYGAVAFVVLPFTFGLFFFAGSSTSVYLGLELAYQLFNFTALLCIFRTYLQDSWLNVSIAPKKVLTVSLTAAAVIAVFYAALACFRYLHDSNLTRILWMGTLPMTGIELMLLPGQFLQYGGIWAALVLTVLGPITTACLYYAPVFAPVCAAGHRFAAYLAVAGITAVPRIITYFTVWGGWKELPLYLIQLPIHFLACWTYQKTNTVWAPIYTHAIVNALCCAVLYGLYFIVSIG